MDDEQPYRGVVEVRIHGVSGTSPEALLDRSPVRQVAGDAIGGFYRPVLAERMRDRPNGARSGRGPWLEAYSWGGWTSGARTRALWLALLPFALVNVAPRMLPIRLPRTAGQTVAPADSAPADPVSRVLPRERGVGMCHRIIGGFIRLLAISLTVTYTFGFAQVAFVTIGRRCGQVLRSADQPTCEGLPSWLVGLLQHLSGSGQLAVSALVPMAAVGLLWALSTKASQRYEDIDPEKDEPTPVLPDDDRMPLGRRELWRGSRRVRRLRMLHIHAGFATIAGLLAFVLPASGPRTITLGLTVLTVAIAAVAAIWRPRNESTLIAHRARLNWITLALTYLSAVILLIFAHTSGPEDLNPTTMVLDLDHLYLVLFAVQAGLLLLVLIALLGLRFWPRRAEPAGSVGTGKPARMRLLGLGTFVFAFLGWLVGLMFTAAFQILAPTWIYTKGFIFGPAVIADFIGRHREWFGSSVLSSGYGMLAALALIALLILAFLVSAVIRMVTGGTNQDRRAVAADYSTYSTYSTLEPVGRVRERIRDVVNRYRHEGAADIPGPGTESGPLTTEDGRKRAKSIAFMFWMARRADYAPIGLGALCVGMALFLSAQFTGYFGAGYLVVKDVTAGGKTVVGTAVAWGAYFTVAALVGAIVLGVASYRVQTTRKGVGVLWDLTCFWPRDVHPFAPPCYTERIVPEVSRRIKAYFAGDGGQAGGVPGADRTEQAAADDPAVILAAHSQGTVIGMAVLLAQPPDFRLGRVGLLTFGTVLDRLYARYFPRYFSADAFGTLARNLTGADGLRWINLWRHSDYLGGSVPYPPADPDPAGGPEHPADGPEHPAGPENVRATDPDFGVPADGIIYPPAGRHSNYWRDPEFQVQIGKLIGRFGAIPADAIPCPAPDPAFPVAPPTIR